MSAAAAGRAWRTRTTAWCGLLIVGLVGGLTTPAFAAATAPHVLVVPVGQSIQQAIDRARPGDTVRVAAGTFRENLHITTDGLQLLGAERGTTRLIPPVHATRVCGAPASQVNGICVGAVTQEPGSRTRGVRISRLAVRGFPGAGVLLFGTRSAQVLSSTFSDNGNGVLGLFDRGSAISGNRTDDNENFGVALIFSERARLVRNRASGNVAGLEVANSATGDVLLEDNRAVGNLYGILVADASHGRISRNTVERNCAGVIIAAEGGPGVSDWTVDHNFVRANNRVCPATATEPAVSGGGIVLLGAQHVEVSANAVLSNRPGVGGAGSFSGGIVVRSARPFGVAADPVDVTVRTNGALRNAPADLVYDDAGRDVAFHGNTCSRSIPSGLCG